MTPSLVGAETLGSYGVYTPPEDLQVSAPTKLRNNWYNGWGTTRVSTRRTSVLDSMVDGLGLTSQVNRGIEAMHLNQEATERQARFIRADEDGQHAVMMAQNATQDFGASSRDANYRENMRCVVDGRYEKGYCAIANCQHLEMDLRHKCDTCGRYVHILCLMDNNLLISEVGSNDRHYCSRLCKS
jgi:hypothetical protein